MSSFVLLKPFYNGLARVRLTNGLFALINENGQECSTFIRQTGEVDDELEKLALSYWKPLAFKLALDGGLLSPSALAASLTDINGVPIQPSVSSSPPSSVSPSSSSLIPLEQSTSLKHCILNVCEDLDIVRKIQRFKNHNSSDNSHRRHCLSDGGIITMVFISAMML